MIEAAALQRWVWIIQESCDEDDCPCESPQVLLETNEPRETLQRVHMDLVSGGWFATLAEAITYFSAWIDHRVPFTVTDLHCLHDPSVHDADARAKMHLPYQSREDCNYQGILLISEEGDKQAEDRTFVVFERLEFVDVAELERQHERMVANLQGVERQKEPV